MTTTSLSLRVCLDARLVGGTSGGIESVVIGMTGALSRLMDGQVTYLILAYPDAHEWLKPFVSGACSLLFTRKPAPPQYSNAQSRTVRLARTVADMVVPLLGPSAIRVPRSDGTIEKAGVHVMHFLFQSGFLTEIPSIYHPHDLQHIHLPQFFSPRIRLKREMLYRGLCQQARMVAVASGWSKCDLIQHYGLGEDKVRVIAWPPVVEQYPQPTIDQLQMVKRKFDLPERFVFYPAQTWPHKNHLALLEALAILRQKYSLCVSLVSSGRLYKPFFYTLQQRAHTLQIADQVRFLDFVSPLELMSLYALCRCVVVPTKLEATSQPVAEAFWVGAPVACSNVTSLPEQAGDAALIFDPNRPGEIAEAIRRLWIDDALCQSLVARGKRNIERFSWERTARIFRAHYRRIAGRPLAEEDRALLLSLPEY